MVQKKNDKGVIDMLKILRRMEYKNLILPQEDTFYSDHQKSKKWKTIQRRCKKRMVKISRKLQAITGNSKTRLNKKFNKRHHKGLWILGNWYVVN